MNWFKSGGTASALVAVILLLAILAHGVTREVPLGGIDGRVTMAENGRGLVGTTVILRSDVDVEGFRTNRTFEVTKPGGDFTMRNLPAGTYTIEAYARAHTLDTVTIEVTEGAPTLLQLEMKPVNPYLNVYASQRVFTPDESSVIQVNGFTEADGATVQVHRIDRQAILQKGGIAQALSPVAYRDNGLDELKSIGRMVHEFQVSLDRRDEEGVFMQDVRLPKLPAGIYWVQTTAGKLRKGVSLNVTDIGMVTKFAQGEVLAFVTDIRSGEPLAGVPISVAAGPSVGETAKTASDGTAKFSLPLSNANQQVVFATRGESQAFVEMYVSEERDRSNGGRLFSYTERPVYRPGDTVLFKGIARRLVGADYRNVGAKKIRVELRDPWDALVESFELTSNDMGTFHGSAVLNREARTGDYRLVSTMEGATYSHSFTVSAYRKPEYTVSVKGAEPYTAFGKTARVVVESRYFFGGPVVGAKVTAHVLRQPHWDYSWMDDELAEYYADEGGEGGEYVGELEGVTDDNGRAVLDFETRLENDNPQPATDYLYTVTAYVAEGDESFDGSGSIKVTRADIGLTVDTDRYIVNPGEKVEVQVRAHRHSDSQPAVGQTVRIEVGRESWSANESTFKLLQSISVITDKDGTDTIEIDPKEVGSLSIRAVAQDGGGRTVTESTYLYVSGGAYGGAPGPGLKITLDKKVHQIGDTAKALIAGMRPGGSALVTVEGERVYWSKVVKIDSESQMIEFPVLPEMSPNAFFTVAYGKDKRFSEASTRVGVSLGTRDLNVTVSSDQKRYQPGDTVTYAITTRDKAGRPVPSEVSLGVVDESIYAILEDRTNILEGFYPKRYNVVQTNYSFAEMYLDGGDKSPNDIEVRSKFLDTAYWNPNIRTDANGRATVRVKLPDNLTGWRATVTAVSDATHVGRGTTTVRARKDLMVRLETPQFMIEGDEIRLNAFVVNDTGRPARVSLDLEAEGLELSGDRRRTVDAEQGRSTKVEWRMTARRTGRARVVAKGWIQGGATDGVEAVVPVHPHGRLVIEQTAGDFEGSSVLPIEVRPNADRNTGRVILSLSPTLAGSLVHSLDDLIGFPYGCTEQTMSRFMPTVIVSHSLQGLGLPQPSQAAQIPEMVREGYARLLKMQHSDGSWGWWEYDEGDPFMTAYVVEGIRRAEAAGYASPIPLTQTSEWVTQTLDGWNAKKGSRADKLYLIAAAAYLGQRELVAKHLAAEDSATLDAREAAMALLAALRSGQDAEVYRTRLLSLVTDGPATAHWRDDHYGTETTSRAFAALAEADPRNPVLPKVARYLILARQGDSWISTRDTAFALIGLTTYMRGIGERADGMTAEVLVNGRSLKTISLSPQQVFGPGASVEIPLAQLAEGRNRIEIQEADGRRVYWGLDVRQTVREPRLPAVVSGAGLKVGRAYYRLQPTRMEDGGTRLMPSKEPLEQFQSGEPVRVVLTIEANAPHEFLMIEDMLPSNFRVQDRGMPTPYEWTWWYSSKDIRDDRIAFFARRLEAGKTTIEYTMRSEQPGRVRVLPTVVSNMYDPLVRATSTATSLEVR